MDGRPLVSDPVASLSFKSLHGESKPAYVSPSEETIKNIVATHRRIFLERVTTQVSEPGRWDAAYRIGQLKAMRRMVVENAKAFEEAAHKDIGRTSPEAFMELKGMTGDIDVLCANLRSWMRPQSRKTPLWLWPARSYQQYQPLGVCLVLGTWNYASVLSLLPMAGAIAAGNAVVLKPSEFAPAQAELMAHLVGKYLDPELVSVVLGGAETGKGLVDLGDWDFVFYTGGPRAGAAIGASCASRLIPCALELGGKSPTVLDESANLAVAARRIVQGKWVNCGQTCIAPDYCLVVSSSDAFKAKVTEALVKELKAQYGENVLSSPFYARIVNDNHLQRLIKLMQGEKVIHGGEVKAEDKYIEPTIVDADANQNTPLMTEEIFGPILPIFRVNTLDEAIAFIRSRPKPLTLYVFSNNKANIKRLLSRTSSGSVCVNDALMQYLNPNLPFGGVGTSGKGAYHGEASFREFSHALSVLEQSSWLDLPFRYPPLSIKWRGLLDIMM